MAAILPAAWIRRRSTALRSTIRPYWADVDGGGRVVAEGGEVAGAADRLELAVALERLRDRDDVDRLAVLEELQHRGVDAAVGLAVEVLRVEEVRDLDDRVAVDEDGAEHGLLGVEVLGRQSVDHGWRVPGLSGLVWRLQWWPRRAPTVTEPTAGGSPIPELARPVGGLWTAIVDGSPEFAASDPIWPAGERSPRRRRAPERAHRACGRRRIVPLWRGRGCALGGCEASAQSTGIAD